MKTKILALICILALAMGAMTPAQAFDDYSPESMAADGLVVRPVCFAATVVGSAIFVVTLPFTAIAGKVGKTADTLVGKPARATFVRDMGDFSSF